MIRIRNLLLLLIACSLLLTGCENKPLPTSYGHRRGAVAAKSVNGIGVLSEMFESAGWETASWRRMSPKLRESDVIFWAPDSFNPPTDEQVDWLEDWLDRGYGRTLVLVGRGYDGAPAYWRDAIPKASKEDQEWMTEERKQADYVWKSDLEQLGKESKCRWYTMTPSKSPPRKVTAFSADSDWAVGVDAAKAEVFQTVKLTPPKALGNEAVEIMLKSKDGEVLAYRMNVDGNRVIVVANASFLLNVGLVNKENRKLAGRLIEDCNLSGSGKVTFIEQTPGRLRIYEQEPANDQRSGFTMLTIWPLGFLLLHLLMLGSVVCFVAFPIFGRPKRLKNLGVSDFGKHIQALGALIAATQNRTYALERLKYYEDHVRRETREN